MAKTIEVGPYKSTVPLTSSKRMIEALITDMMINMYRADPVVYERDLDNQVVLGADKKPIQRNMRRDIEAAYQELIGRPFNWNRLCNYNMPRMILGPPGQGKTTSYREATKVVARSLNLNYVECPDERTEVHDNDFVFGSIEMAGEDSNMALFGLPNIKIREDGHKEMGRITNSLFAKMKYAAGSTIIFDDLTAADKTLTGALHSIMLERQAQGYRVPDSCTLGATGNLGRTDATASEELSSAFSSRVQAKFMYLEMRDFLELIEDKYPTSKTPGISMLTSFLNTHNELYNTQPRQNSMEAYSTPRSIENLIPELVMMECEFANNPNSASYKARLEKVARSLVGPEFGTQFSVHAYMYRSNAIPIAKAFINEGKLTPELQAILDREYQSENSSKSVNFSTQVAYAMADELIRIMGELPTRKYPEGEAAEDHLYRHTANLSAGIVAFRESRMAETALRRLVKRAPTELTDSHPWVNRGELLVRTNMLMNKAMLEHEGLLRLGEAKQKQLKTVFARVMARQEGKAKLADAGDLGKIRSNAKKAAKAKESELAPAP